MYEMYTKVLYADKQTLRCGIHYFVFAELVKIVCTYSYMSLLLKIGRIPLN